MLDICGAVHIPSLVLYQLQEFDQKNIGSQSIDSMSTSFMLFTYDPAEPEEENDNRFGIFNLKIRVMYRF